MVISRASISLFPLILVACSIQPPEPEPAVLPEITMEGLNTFGCTVAGEVYQARSNDGPFDVFVLEVGNTLTFDTQDEETDERVKLLIRFPDSPFLFPLGKHYINQSNLGIHPGLIEVYDPDYKVEGAIVLSDSSFFEILYIDEEARIIAGTFQFDAETVDGDTIQIRKGRFDAVVGY